MNQEKDPWTKWRLSHTAIYCTIQLHSTSCHWHFLLLQFIFIYCTPFICLVPWNSWFTNNTRRAFQIWSQFAESRKVLLVNDHLKLTVTNSCLWLQKRCLVLQVSCGVPYQCQGVHDAWVSVRMDAKVRAWHANWCLSNTQRRSFISKFTVLWRQVLSLVEGNVMGEELLLASKEERGTLLLGFFLFVRDRKRQKMKEKVELGCIRK